MRNLGNIKIITGAELAVVLDDDTQLTIDSEHISMNGIVLDDSTSLDGQFTIGAAVTGQLTITILNEDELYSPYNFRGATCQLTLLGVDEIFRAAQRDQGDFFRHSRVLFKDRSVRRARRAGAAARRRSRPSRSPCARGNP